MNVVMVGAGYVGLVSGACFSEFGVEVVCVDHDEARIESLGRGEIPIYEPGLEDIVRANEAAGRLSFSGDLGACVADADAVFIAVGTPARRGNGHAPLSRIDLSQLASSFHGCVNHPGSCRASRLRPAAR